MLDVVLSDLLISIEGPMGVLGLGSPSAPQGAPEIGFPTNSNDQLCSNIHDRFTPNFDARLELCRVRITSPDDISAFGDQVAGSTET